MQSERQNEEQNTQISEDRQLMYYLGMALSAIGVLVFFSTFFVMFSPQRQPVEIQVFPSSERGLIERNRDILGIPRETTFARAPEPAQIFTRALSGMALMALGGFLMSIGEKGLAGSGVVLNPHQAREDLKPWSQMAGGMFEDALSQSQSVTKALDGKSEPSSKSALPIVSHAQ